MTIRELWLLGTSILESENIRDAKVDAGILLDARFDMTYSDRILSYDKTVSREEEQAYLADIRRRAKHFPVQQITGVQEFCGLTFHVTEDVLIPRQDTEVLVDRARKYVTDQHPTEEIRILDLCCGSGCIGLSLERLLSDKGISSHVVLADISEKALSVTRKNAENLESKAEILQSDLFDKVQGKYNLIVSNPPYIRDEVIETLDPEVKDHEPRLALSGKEDGLYFYRKIVEHCRENLEDDGAIFFEIGYDQGEDVSNLLRDAGFTDVQVIRDDAGLNRVIYAS